MIWAAKSTMLQTSEARNYRTIASFQTFLALRNALGVTNNVCVGGCRDYRNNSSTSLGLTCISSWILILLSCITGQRRRSGLILCWWHQGLHTSASCWIPGSACRQGKDSNYRPFERQRGRVLIKFFRLILKKNYPPRKTSLCVFPPEKEALL